MKEPAEQPSLRRGVRRPFGNPREEIGQAGPPGRHDDQVVLLRESIQVSGRHVADHHLPASLDEQLVERREVHAHVYNAHRLREDAAEHQGLLAVDPKVDSRGSEIGRAPVVHPERSLARLGAPKAGHEVGDAASPNLLRRTVAVDGGSDAACWSLRPR